MFKYECYNPITWTLIQTDYMGEADFWASLGYTVVDHPRKVNIG